MAFLLLIPLMSGLTIAGAKGHLVIIGGGQRPAYLMEKMVALGGGPLSRVLIVPTASSVPLEVALFQKYQFEKAGAAQVDFVLINRESVDHDSTLQKLDEVTVVFFSGGNQSRLTEVLLGSEFLEKIRRIYRDGGVLGGTSAGAAVMSELMITGEERKYGEEDPSFATIESDNIVLKPGFAFVNEAIIDQHFIQRKRHNRLLSAVLQHPKLLGIGIDESTAIVVKPDRTLEVLGERTVAVYDARRATVFQTEKGLLSARGMDMHLLKSGDAFDLKP